MIDPIDATLRLVNDYLFSLSQLDNITNHEESKSVNDNSHI